MVLIFEMGKRMQDRIYKKKVKGHKSWRFVLVCMTFSGHQVLNGNRCNRKCGKFNFLHFKRVSMISIYFLVELKNQACSRNKFLIEVLLVRHLYSVLL